MAENPDPDRRVTCQACRHWTPGWCGNARAAGLSNRQRAEVGMALAKLPQWCGGYAAGKQARP
jgi:hypothetical protein